MEVWTDRKDEDIVRLLRSCDKQTYINAVIKKIIIIIIIIIIILIIIIIIIVELRF